MYVYGSDDWYFSTWRSSLLGELTSQLREICNLTEKRYQLAGIINCEIIICRDFLYSYLTQRSGSPPPSRELTSCGGSKSMLIPLQGPLQETFQNLKSFSSAPEKTWKLKKKMLIYSIPAICLDLLNPYLLTVCQNEFE